ncbi:MAG: hypothetical protein AAB433_12460 [Nitrospirota bacterium]
MTHFVRSPEVELLSEHMQISHLIKCSPEAATAALERQLSRFGTVEKREFSAFKQAMEYLLPIKSFVTRYLTVQIGEWVWIICDMRLSDCYSDMMNISKDLTCEAVLASALDSGRRFYYIIAGNHRRIVQCYEDGNRWVFFEKGAPLECERVANYTLKRKPDRFKTEDVWRCANFVTGIVFPINWIELRDKQVVTLERSLQNLKVPVQLYETKWDVTL